MAYPAGLRVCKIYKDIGYHVNPEARFEIGITIWPNRHLSDAFRKGTAVD